ncbi:cupin domain-containing protein [Chryseolinea sp. T2]|uniref:cupin domain-containing protein n=1 Tax=Chryseolinea sp. T2 TaxID=3129255 RepID=UPI0030789D2D
MNELEKKSIAQTERHAFRNYQGGYFKTLISPEQSGGSLAILDLVLPAGAEPPPHIHTQEDETFVVLEGKMEVRIGNASVKLEAGESIFAPRNVPHSFKILGEKARLLNLITPGTMWAYFMAFSEPCVGEPKVTKSLQPPSPEQIQSMISVLTNLYQLKFV